VALPIKDGKITTKWKQPGKHWSSGFHTGVDFAQPVGTPVYAVADGKVANANWGKAYGTQIVQDLGDGTFCIYAHLSKSNKKAGEAIAKGELIGYVGNTGNSTGAHLHFERRNNIRWSAGQPIDPTEILGA
jgi:murein DD-endopeptidase MepM/ murein hydrolase activator NlpD